MIRTTILFLITGHLSIGYSQNIDLCYQLIVQDDKNAEWENINLHLVTLHYKTIIKKEILSVDFQKLRKP